MSNDKIQEKKDLECEEKLKMYHTFIEMAPDGIIVVDEKGMIFEVNRSYTQISGYKREEMLGKKFLEFISCIEERTKAEQMFLSFNEDDSAIPPIEFSIPSTKGVQIPIEMAIGVLKDDIGKFAGTINIFREITQHKHIQDKLLEIEHKFRIISESSVVGLAIIQDNLLKYVNDGFLRINEFTREEVQNWVVSDLFRMIHSVDIPLLKEQYYKWETKGFNKDIFHFKCRVFTKTNKTKWVEIFSNLTYYQGKPAEIVTIVDITDQKRREEENRKRLQELKLTNKELRGVATTISHDLKAPLRGIAYLTDWLAEEYTDKLDAEGKQRINLILDRVKRMDALVDSILKYSLLGHFNEEKSKVDLRKLIEEIIDLINPPSHIQIRFITNLPNLVCKRTHITQIFQNLLHNAIKFMDKSEGLIQVQCEDEGEYWKFSISDNGPGIEEKYFDKIFQILQTLAPRDEIEGSGIGLTVVKKIVEQEGGEVWLESELNKGSTFYFTHPKSRTE